MSDQKKDYSMDCCGGIANSFKKPAKAIYAPQPRKKNTEAKDRGDKK